MLAFSSPFSKEGGILGKEESRQHHDIIQQEYLDTYYNLTIKTLTGMNLGIISCGQHEAFT